MIQSINPANNQVIKTYQEISDIELSEVLSKMQTAFEDWKTKSFNYRASLMKTAAKILRNKKEEFSKLMTLEMGKPILQSRAEIDKCAWVCDYYADNAEKFCYIPTAWCCACSYALEFSFLASVQICRSNFDGRKCWFT